MATTWRGSTTLGTWFLVSFTMFLTLTFCSSGIFKQLQHFKPMAEDMAHYTRAKFMGSPDYCLQWLWDAACRYLAMKREDYMRDSLNRSLKQPHARAVPGLDVKPSRGKGKGTADKKGKPKSRSKSTDRKSKGATGASRGRSQSREGKGKPSN